MSYLIPGWELSSEVKSNTRKLTIDAGMKNSIKYGLWSKPEYAQERALLPEDLGLTSWRVPRIPAEDPAAHRFIPWIDGIIQKSVQICIWKVMQLSGNPKATQMRLEIGASCIGQYDLESCYGGLPLVRAMRGLSDTAMEVLARMTGKEYHTPPAVGFAMEGWFNKPILLLAYSNFRITLHAPWDIEEDELVLGGVTIEQKGLTIV